VPELYIDSRGLVKRHAQEAGTPWVQTITATATGNTILTSRITVVEVVSAFQRKQRDSVLTGAEVTQLTSDFLALCTNQYALVEISVDLLNHARTLIERHPLRAYDAVQLASALVANFALQAAELGPLTFVASDRQLLTAAQAERLEVDSPYLHL
jgi:hypothetical protein